MPDPTPAAAPSFIPPKVAGALAIVSALAAGAAAYVPANFAPWVAILAICSAGLAGIALPQFKLTEGKPLVSPAVAGVLGSTGVGGLIQGLQGAVPPGWPQALVYAASAVLATLAGKSLPSFAPAQAAGLKAAADDQGKNLGA
jgi:hypothetical protein